jgi:hypothetical protein
MTTRTFRFTVQSGTPSWALGSVNQWVTIPNTALLPTMQPNLAVGTSSLAGFYAYSAGALHPTTLNYYAVGGGHGDGASNAVYRLNLAAQSPAWVSVSTQTPVNSSTGSMWASGQAFGTTDGYAYYWDGKPCSRHTWSSCAQIVTTYGTQGQLMLIGVGSAWGSGNGRFRTMDSWDIASQAYTWINPNPLANPNGPNPNFTEYTTGVFNEAIKDSRGNFWVTVESQGSQIGTVRWVPATKTWSNLVSVSRETSGCAVYDSLRDRIVQLPTTATGSTGHYFSAVDGSGLTFFAWSGTPPTNLINRYRGSAWHDPNIDRYVYMPQDTTQIWHIHPTTFAATQQTTTGTAPALLTGGGLGSVGNRFHYIPQYRGCILMTQVSTNAAFIRTN